jgi:hypothetical protein
MGDLSQAVKQISSVAASGNKPQTIIQESRAALERHLRATRVQIQLRAASHQFISETYSSESAKRSASGFLFSKALSVRGKEYGTLQVDLSRPENPLHELLETLETVCWLLAIFAERLSLTEEHARLKANAQALDAAIAASKIVSRAAGVVANLRGLPYDAALACLQAEAARTRRPIGMWQNASCYSRTARIG